MALTSWTLYGNGNGRDDIRMRRGDTPQQSYRRMQGDPQSFRRLQGEMNRLFENFFGNSNVQAQPWSGTAMPSTETNVNVGSPTPTTVSSSEISRRRPTRSRQFNPCLEVTEDAETIHVICELPGMDSSDIEVFCNENSLTITGEKRHRTMDDGNFLQSERAYGAFRRVIPFNLAVDTDDADAEFENGVLHVRLPKAGSSKGTKLNLQ